MSDGAWQTVRGGRRQREPLRPPPPRAPAGDGKRAPAAAGAIPVPCRYFALGTCRNGKTCPFLHPTPAGAAKRSAAPAAASATAVAAPRVHGPLRPKPAAPAGDAAAAQQLQSQAQPRHDARPGLVIVDDDADDTYFFGAPGTFRATRPHVEQVVPPKPNVSWAAAAAAAAVASPHGDTSAPRTRPPLADPGFPRRRPDTVDVCIFFVQGSCRYGDECRYAHTLPDYMRGDAEGEVAAPGGTAAAEEDDDDDGVVAAACRPWDEEGEFEEACRAWAEEDELQSWVGNMDIWRADDLGDASAVGSAADAEAEEVRLERLNSATQTCGICLERVLGRGERFGILQNCDHAFCLTCIREWRRTAEHERENLRRCPLCRVESYFVIPCDRHVMQPERKQRLITAYRTKLQSIPCAHFNFGEGECPFGTSCFYAHLNKDGTPAAAPQVRLRVDAEGLLQPVKQVRLSDFF